MPVNVRTLFSGDVYSNTMTMTDDGCHRFEMKDILLLDAIIIVETNALKLGSVNAVVYPVGVGDTVGFTMVNLKTLHFKNATASSNGKISILGVMK